MAMAVGMPASPWLSCSTAGVSMVGVPVLGASAAFLVTDQGVTGAGITAQLEGYITEAGIECVVFDQVEANPTMSIVSAWQKALLPRW